MNIIHALVLGVVQGVTEFLPISSSGHLILLPDLLGWQDQGLAVDAVLHLATALAILIYFRNEWIRMLLKWRTSQSLRKIVIASIPAAVVGLLFGDAIESLLRSPWTVVVMLVMVALVMWFVESRYAEITVVDTNKKPPIVPIDWPEVFIMSVAQVFALIPGTSRSGITISAGMFRNVNRVNAAKFSFLLGVPVTLGAGLVKLPDLISATDTDWLFVGVAAVTTFVVAIFVMRWLLNFLKGHTLKPFVIYRIALAVVVAAFLLFVK
ncbi:undecaprenyl-diphosphatase UppP [candidate division WWE3 bacterium]|uniref:Undecaprenyl-diphosphatase n=1 Tax=candidate division WWE3 bacterium TaxID=2053526 RepID=A0A955LJ08_UNCKA|nr:undecaprenyl-diphosphatase UppP [candidate division WWE3 bacterium]